MDIPPEFLIFVLIGFGAQMVDGALGMAYGTLSTAILLATGLPPATVSASVHAAQSVTSAMSAASHITLKNVQWSIFLPLAMFGTAGGILGALFLSHADMGFISPLITGYLLILGVLILIKVIRPEVKLGAYPSRFFKSILGFCAGILDAMGSGWGPITTTTLVAKGVEPRYVVGSVNTAEFVVKTSITITFMTTIGITFGPVVLGLLFGGVLAAPLAALTVKYINTRVLMALVGVLIIGISVFRFMSL
jgi:uncharacterized membrane protein YfcA